VARVGQFHERSEVQTLTAAGAAGKGELGLGVIIRVAPRPFAAGDGLGERGVRQIVTKQSLQTRHPHDVQQGTLIGFFRDT